MKTSQIIIISGIIITISLVSVIFLESPFQKEHYDIEIFGLKDVYLVGEQYSFYYIISGYGYSCADREVVYPDQNGNTMQNGIDVNCNTSQPKTKFVIDSRDESEMKPIAIKNPGRYAVGITFDNSPPTHVEPTQKGDGFHVVEKICNDQRPQNKIQCFADAFDSCTSAFVELAYPTGEGDGILVTGVVESWYDCSLRVYTDHTQDRYRGDYHGSRSICEGLSITEESLIFENCNNADIPPLRFDKQYYLHKEKCEMNDGWWNFEYATCIDFSDEYDCIDMGGELVNRAYTGEQPDYTKKSDSFVCDFVK